MTRPLLPADRIAPPAADRMARWHEADLSPVIAAVDTHDVVVVGMAWNPHVPKVRRALDEAGIAHHDVDLGSYVSGWKARLAIKLWSGWPTFPQVFVKGTLFGGNADVRQALADGTLRARLDAPR